MSVRSFSLGLLILESAFGQLLKGIEVRGEYRNLGGYSYRVTVPEGFVGYRMPAPAPAHGFALSLGPNTENRISVDGSYNAAEHQGARDVLETTIAWIKGKATSIEVPQFHTSVLGGLPAEELTVRYRDKKASTERVCRSVAAIRRDKPSGTVGIVYEIILDDSAERFSRDLAIYESLVRSFRLDALNQD
jgi:hypothetical protein